MIPEFSLQVLRWLSPHVTDLVLTKPYQEVDWERYAQYKTNLHIHTWKSDGLHSAKWANDAYRRAGYDILSLTDHNTVTWPWKDHGHDPEKPVMLAVLGNGLSDAHRHEMRSLITSSP